MNIIVGREHADQLKEKYTVLELEKFTRNDILIEAYCVIPADKINLADMMTLESDQRLHAEFIEANSRQDWERMRELDEHLHGKFGGELDSFYEEILSREP